MKVQEIRALARERGLKLRGNASKAEMIRALQLQEGNFDCFGRATDNYCDQANCLWREECLQKPKKRKP